MTLEVPHERSTQFGEVLLLGALGRNQRPLVFMSVSEARRTLTAPILALRFERAERDELLDPADRRHATIYPVMKIEVGGSQQRFEVGSLRVDLGGNGAIHHVGSELSDAYGSSGPLSASLHAGIPFGGGHH